MRTNRPYVQIDPDVLERVRQIDLLSYLREFEPSNLVKVKGTSNVYCTACLLYTSAPSRKTSTVCMMFIPQNTV